ncbi:MAG: LCP family protein, partial [Desertimonas sp.]
MPGADPRRTRRTGSERLAIGASITTAVIAVVAAAALTIGYVLVTSRTVAPFQNPAEVATGTQLTLASVTVPVATAATAVAATGPLTTPGPTETDGRPERTTTATTEATDTAETAETADTTDTTQPPTTESATTESATTPVATFPDIDPDASNFLLTGADNGACIDPDSPYAGAFGDREGMGERSDTIMLVRVDPSTSRLAILSFPRDLWVEIAGTGSQQRINSAYRRDDPQRLVDTIYENFGIGVDHFIQVDFCAFKTLVDAVGGVAVPFEFPARDDNTGLNVPSTGCFTFDGEHALAYVRSRHYEYENPPGSGEWDQDGTSDLGRISRQQDFLRRVLSAVLSKGPLNPSVAGGLLEAAQKYVVTDPGLSPQRLMEFAGVLSEVEPGSIPTYQIEARPRTIGGADVLVPEIEGDNMQSILALFRGESSLGEAPDQILGD